MPDDTRHWWPVEPFDACDYQGSPPPPAWRHLAPLSGDRAVEVGLQVQQPEPPDRWLELQHSQMETRSWYEWHWYRGIPAGAQGQQRRIRGSKRQRIIERDGLVCGICGGGVPATKVDIDHIIPSSLGGTDEEHNLQVAHQSCNRRKGARV